MNFAFYNTHRILEWAKLFSEYQGAQHQLKGKKRTTLTVTLLTQGVMPCNIFFVNTV